MLFMPRPSSWVVKASCKTRRTLLNTSECQRLHYSVPPWSLKKSPGVTHLGREEIGLSARYHNKCRIKNLLVSNGIGRVTSVEFMISLHYGCHRMDGATNTGLKNNGVLAWTCVVLTGQKLLKIGICRVGEVFGSTGG